MSTYNLTEISESIENKCKKSGYSKTQAAIECGAKKDFFANMGKGSYPSLDKFIKMADFLGVSLDDLIGRESPNNASYSTITGNNSGNANNTNCNFGSAPQDVPEEALEIAEMLRGLSFRDRAELMGIISDYYDSHKKG